MRGLLRGLGLTTVLITGFVTTLPGPAAVPGDKPDVPGLDRARRAADALGSELKTALMREMSRGGPANAVQICSEQAMEIAASHSGDGLSVRRVSLKARNPQDEPDTYERRKLQEMEAAHREGNLPPELYEEIADDSGRRLRYLRPLTIRSTCLHCHGEVDAMQPEVREILAERYPDDPAVGYQDGDLRGAISVVVLLD